MIRAACILCIALLTAGCAGFQRAYEERVCWRNGLPEECPAHAIQFGCSRLPVTLLDHADWPAHTASLFIASDPPALIVGDLFSQNGDKPIYLQGTPTHETLSADLSALLAQHNVHVVTGAGRPDLVLDGQITLMDVRSEPGGFFDLKVPTVGRVEFHLTAADHSGAILWSRSFSGRQEIFVSYAYLKDSEQTLNGAYCAALQSFSDFLDQGGMTFRHFNP